MFRKSLAALCLLAAFGLAACDPTAPDANVAATSSTVHALCGTAKIVLPVAYAYVPKTAAWQTRYAQATESVRIYCAGPISTSYAEAVANLSVALSPFLAVVVRTPALMTLAKTTPGWRAVGGWQGLR